jgi:hypothetical protein
MSYRAIFYRAEKLICRRLRTPAAGTILSGGIRS